MNAIRILVVSSVAALASECANPGAPSAAHASHGMSHMDKGSGGSMATTNPRTQTMQQMHQKMMNAKTPEERQALMADHVATTQMMMDVMAGRMPPAPSPATRD